MKNLIGLLSADTATAIATKAAASDKQNSRKNSVTNNETVDAPILPRDRNILELLKDEKKQNINTLHSSPSLKVFMVLAEDKIFLQGFNKLQWSQKNPAILRGNIIIKIMKPIKLKSISLKFNGLSVTEWPEGMPHVDKDPSNPNNRIINEYHEHKEIVNHTWPFYKNDNISSTTTTTSNNYPINSDEFLKESSGSNMYYPLSVINTNNSGSANGLSTTLSNSSSLKDDEEFTQPNYQDQQRLPMRSLSPLGGLLDGITRRRSSTANSVDSFNLSDLLSSSLSNNMNADDNQSIFSGNNNNTITNPSNHNGSGTHFTFQPGYYVYSFEQCIPLSYPETIQSTFGHVSYYLNLEIERVGAFKSNIHSKRQIQLVRSQTDSSVEETEPISIVRDWENSLHYDILIASKDIVLNAFLPISFSFTPLQKVNLHRIRVYLTETVEYFAKGKKVHRLEPCKKILLSEYKAPPLKNLPPEQAKTKAKNLGNILSDVPNDPESGYITYKEIDMQVYIPEFINANSKIHPDTVCSQIKSNHWIKIGLRLSRMIDGKMKHFEISIDSPIHVLNKYCTHGNTLLPSYESHLFFANSLHNSGPVTNFDDNYNLFHFNMANRKHSVSNASNNQTESLEGQEDNTRSNINLGYHSSNIYFPESIVNSPNVEPLNASTHHQIPDITSIMEGSKTPPFKPISNDVTFGGQRSPMTRTKRSQTVTHNQTQHLANAASKGMHRSMSVEHQTALQAPEMQSNLFSPDHLKPEFMSPQALPLGSPLSSPVLGPMQMHYSHTFPQDASGRRGSAVRRESVVNALSASFVHLNENLVHADVPPPPFEERESKKVKSTAGNIATNDPPTYMDVLQKDGIVTKNDTVNQRNKLQNYQLSGSTGNTVVPVLKFTADGDTDDDHFHNNSDFVTPAKINGTNLDSNTTSEEEDFGSGFEFKSLLPSPSQKIGYKDIGALLMRDEDIDPKTKLLDPAFLHASKTETSDRHSTANKSAHLTKDEKQLDRGNDISDIIMRSPSVSPVRSLLHRESHEPANTSTTNGESITTKHSLPTPNLASHSLNNEQDKIYDPSHSTGENDLHSCSSGFDEEDIADDVIPMKAYTDMEFRAPLLNGLSRQNTQNTTINPFYNVFGDSKESILLSDNAKVQDTHIDLRTLIHKKNSFSGQSLDKSNAF